MGGNIIWLDTRDATTTHIMLETQQARKYINENNGVKPLGHSELTKYGLRLVGSGEDAALEWLRMAAARVSAMVKR